MASTATIALGIQSPISGVSAGSAGSGSGILAAGSGIRAQGPGSNFWAPFGPGMGPLGYFSCGSPGRSGCMGDCSRPVQPPGRVKAHDRRSRSLVWGPRTRQSAMYPFKRDRDAALAGLHEGPRVCDGRGKGGDDVENAGGAVQMRSKLQHHVATYSKVAN